MSHATASTTTTTTTAAAATSTPLTATNTAPVKPFKADTCDHHYTQCPCPFQVHSFAIDPTSGNSRSCSGSSSNRRGPLYGGGSGGMRSPVLAFLGSTGCLALGLSLVLVFSNLFVVPHLRAMELIATQCFVEGIETVDVRTNAPCNNSSSSLSSSSLNLTLTPPSFRGPPTTPLQYPAADGERTATAQDTPAQLHKGATTRVSSSGLWGEGSTRLSAPPAGSLTPRDVQKGASRPQPPATVANDSDAESVNREPFADDTGYWDDGGGGYGETEFPAPGPRCGERSVCHVVKVSFEDLYGKLRRGYLFPSWVLDLDTANEDKCFCRTDCHVLSRGDVLLLTIAERQLVPGQETHCLYRRQTTQQLQVSVHKVHSSRQRFILLNMMLWPTVLFIIGFVGMFFSCIHWQKDIVDSMTLRRRRNPQRGSP